MCDVPICLFCVSMKHKSHEMIEVQELVQKFTRENERLQSFRHELEALLNHTTKQLSCIASFYQERKEEVTVRGEEWHKLIDVTVEKLHQVLDDLREENETILQKQKQEFEKMIEETDGMNRKSANLQKSKNVPEMNKFNAVIEELTKKEFTQFAFPSFHVCEPDEKYLKTYFGYVEKSHESKVSLLEKFIPATVTGGKILEMPSVSSVFDTKFPARERFNTRLYDMAITSDKKVWMGGESRELKLFDLQGQLSRTVTIPNPTYYICMHNNQVVFNDYNNAAIKMISDKGNVVTMFTTGDWGAYGITGTASGDLLVCLRKYDQSKVVRYSSDGIVLQEILYDSKCQPLYQSAWYITENVNGDIIATDAIKKEAIAVDRFGIFRYTYSGKKALSSVATDSVGHIFIADFLDNKIHMLDMDGRFLRYIIPKGGIERPRALCLINDCEILVGESLTGLVKKIKFYKEKK